MTYKPNTKRDITKAPRGKTNTNMDAYRAELAKLLANRDAILIGQRTVYSDGSAHDGFMWPDRGWVSAPDWRKEPVCGYGLHFAVSSLDGYDGGSTIMDRARHQIVIAYKCESVYVGDGGPKHKAPRVFVVDIRDRQEIARWLLDNGCVPAFARLSFGREWIRNRALAVGHQSKVDMGNAHTATLAAEGNVVAMADNRLAASALADITTRSDVATVATDSRALVNATFRAVVAADEGADVFTSMASMASIVASHHGHIMGNVGGGSVLATQRLANVRAGERSIVVAGTNDGWRHHTIEVGESSTVVVKDGAAVMAGPRSLVVMANEGGYVNAGSDSVVIHLTSDMGITVFYVGAGRDIEPGTWTAIGECATNDPLIGMRRMETGAANRAERLADINDTVNAARDSLNPKQESKDEIA